LEWLSVHALGAKAQRNKGAKRRMKLSLCLGFFVFFVSKKSLRKILIAYGFAHVFPGGNTPRK
jgi:hypothetical protein